MPDSCSPKLIFAPFRFAAIVMKLFLLLLTLSLFLSCQITPNVDTRKAGEPWNYYGNLSRLYRDQSNGAAPALVWFDVVQFNRTEKADFQKTILAYLKQGYRKTGTLAVQYRFFVDPFEMKKLAADKGANLIIGCWFPVGTRNGSDSQGELFEYWYQFLYKPAAPTPVPSATPTPTPAPSGPEPIGVYGD